MKIRIGFVSNSSSSSFLIPLKNLSSKQFEKLKNHKWCQHEEIEDGRDILSISISSDDYEVREFFEFLQFLESLGIKMSQLQWEEF